MTLNFLILELKKEEPRVGARQKIIAEDDEDEAKKVSLSELARISIRCHGSNRLHS